MGVAGVVLSGKGGTAKTLLQATMAAQASRAGIGVLLVDVDPERNLSHRFRVPRRAGGLAAALTAAGVAGDGDAYDVAAGAARVLDELVGTGWPGVDLLPAGPDLTGCGQVNIADVWLLRDVLAAAGLTGRYPLVLFDTGGRSGSLTTLAMYAADVAYAPIGPSQDAVRKAIEARARVVRIQRAHPLRWAGVVLSGFDTRIGVDCDIRTQAYAAFPGEVRAEIPRRAAVHEAFQLGERLGERGDVTSWGLAGIFEAFLRQHVLADRPVAAAVAR